MNLYYSLFIILICSAYALGAVYKVKVNSNSYLNIRKSPSTDSPIVGSLNNGQLIYVLSRSKGWAKFYKGYVSEKYIVKTTKKNNNYKTNAALNFRKGPSTNHEIITTLKKDTKIIYFGRDPFNNVWAVTNKGYAHSKYLTKIPSSNPTQTGGSSSKTKTFTQKEIIDVSEFNEITDYASVAKSINGVIIRTGYRGYGSAGTLKEDASLNKHYNGFKGKTKIGYYFFSQATTTAEAEEEASYVVNTLIKGKTNNFPIYLDMEFSNGDHDGRADGLSKSVRTNCAIAFINKIKALGHKAGIYANEDWFHNYLDYNRIVNAGASIWIAKYSSEKPSVSQYDMWQYTDNLNVNGITRNVDSSHVYKNVAGW